MKTSLPSDRLDILCWGFLAALSIWLGFPNDLYSIPPSVLLWPTLISVMGANAASWRKAFLRGWMPSGVGMLAALYWLCMPVAQVGGLIWPLAFLCAAAIAFFLALQGGVFAALAFGFRCCRPWLFAPLLAIIWYLLEYSFARAFGFPWLPLAGALAQWPVLIQAADIFGAYFSGALWLCAVMLCLYGLRNRTTIGRTLYVLMACLIFSGMLWYGIFQLGNPQAGEAEVADVIMVEGNVDQNQKWTPPFQKKSLALYLRLTREGLAEAAARGMVAPLILWPETALPFFYETNSYLGEELRAAVSAWHSPLLFGAPGIARPGTNEAVFNRAFLLGPGGQTLGQYDKVHLVPFGEYLPKWLKLDFLEALLQGVGVYEAGNSLESLNYGTLALGVLICYEGIFPWLARDRITGGANILVDISNDGWFGRTPAARQHLFLTVLRCVEQNRWLWRSTNTGISAVADARGRIVFAGPMFRRGFLLSQGRLLAERSVFYYLGPWLPWLALATLCLAAVFAGRLCRDV